MKAPEADPIRQPDPVPDVDEVLQEEPRHITVPVRVEGIVNTTRVPARAVSTSTTPITDVFANVLSRDPGRARVLLCSDVAWQYSRSGATGSGVTLPANTVVELQNGEAVYARATGGFGTLGAIVERWAD